MIIDKVNPNIQWEYNETQWANSSTNLADKTASARVIINNIEYFGLCYWDSSNNTQMVQFFSHITSLNSSPTWWENNPSNPMKYHYTIPIQATTKLYASADATESAAMYWSENNYLAVYQPDTKNSLILININSNPTGVYTGQYSYWLNPSDAPKFESGVSIRHNGVWKNALTWIRVNGQWKQAIAWIRNNGTWMMIGAGSSSNIIPERAIFSRDGKMLVDINNNILLYKEGE